METLTELAIKYDLDKGLRHHNYTSVYDKIFLEKRLEVKNVLEIGIANGNSLRMWRDYFPNAQIYGIDNEASTIFQEDRITCFEQDQGAIETLQKLADKLPEFDIIIDDGSHEPLHQVATAKVLVTRLAPNGIYVIEDVHDPELIERLPFEAEQVQLKQDTDSRLIIFRAWTH